MTKFDNQLRSYATVRQLELIEAVEKHGSQKKAAKALGINSRTIERSLERLKARAALQGHSPEHEMTHTVPDGFKVKGVSSYFDNDGKLRGQWVKSSADNERREQIMREVIESLTENVPRLAPVAPPLLTQEQLCNLYVMTDCHVGMLAWHKEGGHDWDLKIAESTLTGCFEMMVQSSPAARVGFVCQLGDWLHSDGLAPVTPTSHHVLDQDGRFSKIVQASIRILRRLVDLALMKHERVIVLMAEGNHDLASSVWLRAMFKALYENEPRVEVIDSELPYYVYQHGQTMLAFHHGHLKKNDQLPSLMAAQFPRMWGETVKRYAHTGHRHHVEEKEHPGMTVVQHPTLAARDAYAARGGWIAERQAQAITYHARTGKVASVVVTPEMLEAA